MTKFLNILIIFVFLFSITFFCVQSQVNSHNQSNAGVTDHNPGTGDISTDY